MMYQKTVTGYALRFLRDEDVFDVLPRFCAEKHIHAAALSGIGAVKETSCGHFDLATKKFELTKYEKLLELLNLNGNVFLADGKPAIHIHAVFSDEHNNAFGGHVTSLVVGITIEAYLMEHRIEAERRPDDFSGLKLVCLADAYA